MAQRSCSKHPWLIAIEIILRSFNNCCTIAAAYDVDAEVFHRMHQDWSMPEGADEQMQAMMQEQWNDDKAFQHAFHKLDNAANMNIVVTNQLGGNIWLFKRNGPSGTKEKKIGKLGGSEINRTISARIGDIILARAGPKAYKDVLLARFVVSIDRAQYFTLVGRGSPEATHAYFDQMQLSLQDLKARAFDIVASPRERALSMAALLQHSTSDEKMREMHHRLVIVSNIERTLGWKHYTKSYHPFKLFIKSRAASTAAKVESNHEDGIKFRRHSSTPFLLEADGFLKSHEAYALVQTAEDIFSRLPPPLVCFNRGEADMRAVLAASKAPDRWTYLTKQDFLPGSNCLDANVSSDMLTGSSPALGVPPRTVDAMRGEVSFLEKLGERIEEHFGLLDQAGQDFMWVMYDPGSEYMPHTDCLKYRTGRTVGSYLADPQVDRFATVLISLNDDLEGGETSFPNLNISFSPSAGRALVWWNIDPKTGICDTMSTHVAREVHKGRKLILMRWYQYFPVFSAHRSTPLGGFNKMPFQPEVSCDVSETNGSLSCRHYASMTNSGADKGGGNVPLEEDLDEEL